MWPHLTSSMTAALATSGSASSSRSPSWSNRRWLYGLAPIYLADDCCLVTDARPKRLRSADTLSTLLVSRTRVNFGDRAFSAAGPQSGTTLLTDLRQPDLSRKTFLFGHAVGHLINVCVMVCWKLCLSHPWLMWFMCVCVRFLRWETQRNSQKSGCARSSSFSDNNCRFC